MEKWPKHKRQPHGDILGSKKSPLEMGHPCEHLTYLPSLGVDSLQLEELLQITDFFLHNFSDRISSFACTYTLSHYQHFGTSTFSLILLTCLSLMNHPHHPQPLLARLTI